MDKRGEEFKQKIEAKFGKGVFDFSELEYLNSRTLVTLICVKHQTRHTMYPSDLGKLKHVCKDCRNEILRDKYQATLDAFIKKAIDKHGEWYDYSKVDYQGSHKKITIRCKLHGDFEQTPASHLAGRGCKKCGQESMAELKRKDGI